jgi:hypothetical protein
MNTAKERVEQFRIALNDSLNGDRLELLDKWVDFSMKLAKLILLLLGIVVWFPLLSGLEVGVPLISTVIAVFLTFLFEVGYKLAVIRNAVDWRVLFVSYAIYGVWFGFAYGMILVIRQYSRPEHFLILAIAVAASVVVLGAAWRNSVPDFLEERIRLAVNEDMAPFEDVITHLATRFVITARGASMYTVLLLVIGYMLAANIVEVDIPPELLLVTVPLIVLVAFLIMPFIVRFQTHISSLGLLWTIGEKHMTDLMSYCVLLRGRLASLDIKGYKVKHSYLACINERDTKRHLALSQVVCSRQYLPVNHEPIQILTLAADKPDLQKIQRTLGEIWTDGLLGDTQTVEMHRSGRILLGSFPPFFPFSGRTIIDNRVLERNRVAWVSGRPCFGVIIQSEDLLNLKPLTGEIVDMA